MPSVPQDPGDPSRQVDSANPAKAFKPRPEFKVPAKQPPLIKSSPVLKGEDKPEECQVSPKAAGASHFSSWFSSQDSETTRTVGIGAVSIALVPTLSVKERHIGLGNTFKMIVNYINYN